MAKQKEYKLVFSYEYGMNIGKMLSLLSVEGWELEHVYDLDTCLVSKEVTTKSSSKRTASSNKKLEAGE